MSGGAPTRVDVAIVGGGMVGASLAGALAGTGLNVALIEAVRADAQAHTSFDERTTALGNGSQRILATLGAWSALAPVAGPVREIHVSDAGRFGTARLRASDLDIAALGYVVSNRHIGAALWERLASQRGLELRVPGAVSEVQFGADHVSLHVAADGAAPERITARVVVAADGAASLVRSSSGIGAVVEDYEQVAVVVHVATDSAAQGVAYERFTRTGPLAVLPLHDGRFTVVWTLAPDRAREVLAMDESDFIDALQRSFGWRIGRMVRVGARASYPLRLSRSERLTGTRLALVGNAAQALHPVAGQGFNLGLRDAALLAELFAQAPDPGAPAVLEDYQRRRSADRRGMIGFTDGLVKLFASEHPAATSLRALGLVLFDLTPGAKRALARVSWGFGAHTPRLMRGLGVRA